MFREQYPEYFTKTGQVKRNLSAEDKLFIRQALLDEEDRKILIAGGSGLAKDEHLFDCEACEYSWKAALRDVCTKNSGCPKCANHVPVTKQEALARCTDSAPSGYSNFSSANYKTLHSKITYTCNLGHVVTTTTANSFIQGTRCPTCAHQSPDTIYLYQLGNTGVFKIGITSARLNRRRINSVAKSHNCEAVMILLATKSNVKILEATILNKYKHLLVSDMVGDGHTEMLALQPKDISEIKEIINASK